MLDDRDLDRAIDEVAREITGAQVDDSFARRVAVRIETVEVRATRRWSRGWLLVPATASVLLLAVFLIRDERSPLPIRPTDSARATGVKAPDAVTRDATTTTSVASAGVTTGAAVPAAAGLRPVIATRAASPPIASADPDLQPLTTAPIEVAAIDLSPQLGVMPIEIAQIAIDRIEISPMP